MDSRLSECRTSVYRLPISASGSRKDSRNSIGRWLGAEIRKGRFSSNALRDPPADMEGNLAFIFPHTEPRSAASGALLRFGWRLNTVDHIDLAVDALCFQSNSKNPLPHPLGSQCALSPTTSPTRHGNPRGAAFCHMHQHAAGFTL